MKETFFDQMQKRKEVYPDLKTQIKTDHCIIFHTSNGSKLIVTYLDDLAKKLQKVQENVMAYQDQVYDYKGELLVINHVMEYPFKTYRMKMGAEINLKESTFQMKLDYLSQNRLFVIPDFVEIANEEAKIKNLWQVVEEYVTNQNEYRLLFVTGMIKKV